MKELGFVGTRYAAAEVSRERKNPLGWLTSEEGRSGWKGGAAKANRFSLPSRKAITGDTGAADADSLFLNATWSPSPRLNLSIGVLHRQLSTGRER